MDVEDLQPPAHVGQRHHDLPVEAARAHDGRVEDVGAVGRGHHHDAARVVEAVHLDEELVQGLVVIAGGRVAAAPAGAAHRVDLVDVDDARRRSAGPRRRGCARATRRRPRTSPGSSTPTRRGRARPPRSATARASSVLPVPGAPVSSTPRGARPPRRPKRSGLLRNSTVSASASLTSSMPATSAKPTPGRCSRRGVRRCARGSCAGNAR